MSDLATAVTTVIGRCLAVRPGEDVLVIADDASAELGDAMRAAAIQAGGELDEGRWVLDAA